MANIKYGKKVLDYITIDDYKEYLKSHVEKNYYKNYNYGRGMTDAEVKNSMLSDYIDWMNREIELGIFNEDLRYIRQAIVFKSLGYPRESFRCNGNSMKYLAIWDKLPVIEGLELTEVAYTATWGYDQTNVDVAYRANQKVFGLDVFVDLDKEVYLVRVKDNAFKSSVKYFSLDDNPMETFKMDASQTGYYR